VLVACAVRLDDHNVPRPDVSVVERSAGERLVLDVSTVRTVVEVSVSRLVTDLGAKLHCYAFAAVPEYWVVVPAEQYVLRHVEPDAGAYRTVLRIEYDDLGVAVAELAAAGPGVRPEPPT
jgi:Uma2 family endonuclease